MVQSVYDFWAYCFAPLVIFPSVIVVGLLWLERLSEWGTRRG